jgi:hypothetical protein
VRAEPVFVGDRSPAAFQQAVDVRGHSVLADAPVGRVSRDGSIALGFEAREWLRTAANGCGRLRAAADGCGRRAPPTGTS